MKKKIILGIMLIFIIQIFSVVALADTSYPLKIRGEEFVERYIDFNISDGKLVASTYVSEIKGTVKLALIMSEYVDGQVVKTEVNMKTITGDTKYTLAMTCNEGSVYKAYMWNYTSLKPYTNVASYPSSSVAVSDFKFGGYDIEMSEKEQVFTVIDPEGFPIVTGYPVNNGTEVMVTVSSENKTVTIDITSSDKTETDRYIIKYEDISGKFKKWLNDVGINIDAYITTYIITDDGIEYVDTYNKFDPTDPAVTDSSGIIAGDTPNPPSSGDDDEPTEPERNPLIDEYAPYTVEFVIK